MTDVAKTWFLGKYGVKGEAGDGIVKKVDDLHEEQLATMSPDHCCWYLLFSDKQAIAEDSSNMSQDERSLF